MPAVEFSDAGTYHFRDTCKEDKVTAELIVLGNTLSLPLALTHILTFFLFLCSFFISVLL